MDLESLTKTEYYMANTGQFPCSIFCSVTPFKLALTT